MMRDGIRIIAKKMSGVRSRIDLRGLKDRFEPPPPWLSRSDERSSPPGPWGAFRLGVVMADPSTQHRSQNGFGSLRQIAGGQRPRQPAAPVALQHVDFNGHRGTKSQVEPSGFAGNNR